ncbi:HAD family hydrolase [Marinobacter sp. F3R11]|nr:HAD family hydrolase [Marinobacter sp. F3R11]
MREKSEYRTLVFDCDGVVLDSNRLKTDAFFKAALPYGEDLARELVNYHRNNGGISRYRKFDYFLSHLVPEGTRGPSRDELLADYAKQVFEGLLSCDLVPGLSQLKESMPDCRWLIVSGSDQEELRDVFEKRQLLPFFEGGIFGSPDSKDQILAREISCGNILKPALFLGDSRYDHEAARNADLDFVFISQWTEFRQWPDYCRLNNITTHPVLPW